MHIKNTRLFLFPKLIAYLKSISAPPIELIDHEQLPTDIENNDIEHETYYNHFQFSRFTLPY